MNVDINKIIAALKLNNPELTTAQIAEGWFPDLNSEQAQQTLSRIRNGHRQRVINSSFIIRVCEFSKISPNDFFNYGEI